jgi:hypothetical protein
VDAGLAREKSGGFGGVNTSAADVVFLPPPENLNIDMVLLRMF